MTNSDFLAYHSYLKRESLLGFIYRRFILYPFLRILTGPNFLDVGCGVGIFLSYGSRSQSLGLDINPFNVDYVTSRGYRAKLIDQTSSFPVSSNSFSSCIIDQVLEHAEDPSYLIHESYKALIPGGLLIVGLPCEKGFRADPDHKVFYDRDSIISTVQSHAKFSFIRSFYFPFNLRFLGRFLTYNYLYVLFRKSELDFNYG